MKDSAPGLMLMPERPTLHDVASAAGVSTATVSRCLNEPEVVQQKTRERVLLAVRQLGYTPDFSGKALVSGRTNTVGAVIPTMENAIFARGIQAFQETLSETGVTLLVSSSGYDPMREEEQIRALIARGADGLLLIGEARPQSTYDLLARRGIPYVLAWSLGASDDHYVGFDNRAAAEVMARRVISLGHRRIAMIAGVTEMNDRAAARLAGVRDAIERSGLAVSDLLVTEAPYTFAHGSQAFQALIESKLRPTAIICGNDVLAVGAIKRAKELGIRIPRDISITGFDDIDIAEFVEPGLTTVHVPHRRMGSIAARQLLALIGGGTVERRVEIDVQLRMRGSLAEAPDEQPAAGLKTVP